SHWPRPGGDRHQQGVKTLPGRSERSTSPNWVVHLSGSNRHWSEGGNRRHPGIASLAVLLPENRHRVTRSVPAPVQLGGVCSEQELCAPVQRGFVARISPTRRSCACCLSWTGCHQL